MFIPKHLKEWKPEHMRRVPRRRCHWCCSGPHRMNALIHVLESPMRFYFCNEKCMRAWQEHRHDAGVVEWLKTSTGTRAKILKSRQNATKGN